jgi:methylase of polypeptide subunit release factors
MLDEDEFDIIIGNPPYLQLQKLKLSTEDKKSGKTDFQALYKAQNFKTYDGYGDLYCLFYEK